MRWWTYFHPSQGGHVDFTESHIEEYIFSRNGSIRSFQNISEEEDDLIKPPLIVQAPAGVAASFPLRLRVTATAICAVIMVIVCVRNLPVPIVVTKTKDLRNSTYFLINLSLAAPGAPHLHSHCPRRASLLARGLEPGRIYLWIESRDNYFSILFHWSSISYNSIIYLNSLN